MDISLSFKNTVLNGEIDLPASKSISNRVLILNALAETGFSVENLSDCDDTKSMLAALCSDDNHFDVGHAGTAMRFLTAFLARIVGIWEITGSERMKQRPIRVLVEALNNLGARIEYIGEPGFPPLRIYGSFLKGGDIEIAASVSSQYISALMMIAPYMAEGLKMKLTGKIVSRTYIDMTVALMRVFGACVDVQGERITIFPGEYKPIPYRVESDWSGASYFYELLAIADMGQMRLSGLQENSLQGDARQIPVWRKLGICSRFEAGELFLTKLPAGCSCLEFDFVEMPDLVQSFAVACCLKGIPFVFSGVETLKIKETDRISALINELKKLGYLLESVGNGCIKWTGQCGEAELQPVIETYHDHRMAMAFAPAALKYPGLVIRDKDVVTKSFAGYWHEMEKLGLDIKFMNTEMNADFFK